MSELTPKQEGFVLGYLETGNGCEAYRRAYNAETMSQRTVEKRASELLQNEAVAERLALMRAAAADKAVLSRAWVLERLQRNARVALGEERIKVSVRPNGKDSVIELEVTARDAAAANRALELLGKTDEVALFKERHEHTGQDGAPLIGEAPARDVARAVLDILRSAKVSDAPAQTAPADDEELEEEPDGGLALAAHPAVADLAAAVAAAGTPCPGAATSPTPPLRPATLQPGEREVSDNGAEISYAAEFGKFAVHDSAGRLAGYRPDLDAARALAATLKPPPEPRKKRT